MDFNCCSWKVVENYGMCGSQIIACVEANDVSIITIFILVGKTENRLYATIKVWNKFNVSFFRTEEGEAFDFLIFYFFSF